MLKFISKKIHTIIITIFIVTYIFFPITFTEAQLPFGGPITSIIPCNEGSLIVLGPPVGGSFMDIRTTTFYQYGIASHVGQFLLGLSTSVLTCTEPCPSGACPIGAGLVMMFYGSSL